MHDVSDICGALFLYMSYSLHLTTLCTLALSSTLLFIAGPSEPPSLIIIAYILTEPSLPFQLAAAREESREKRKRCETKLRRARVVLQFVRICQSLQLCRAEELVQTAEELLCSCQSWSLMLLPRCRVQGERAAALSEPSHGLLQMSSRLELRGRMTLL